MVIPKINPDEFSAGYLIRLGLCNGYSSFKQITKALVIRHESSLAVGNPVAVHVAHALGISVEQYCQRHTLMPVYRGITNIDPAIPHGSVKILYYIQRLGCFAYTRTLKVCEQCIEEDLDYLGYSYYRRSHQLPGVMACSKHHDGSNGMLLETTSRQFISPDDAELIPADFSNSLFDNTYKRYAVIVDGISNFKKPIPTSLVANKLQKKAVGMGLKWTCNGQGEFYSDHIVNNVSPQLLASLSIFIKTKTRGKKHPTIDELLQGSSGYINPLASILAFAILYKDADEALLELNELGNSAADYKESMATINSIHSSHSIK